MGYMPPLYNENIAKDNTVISEDVIKSCILAIAYLEQSFSKLINIYADEIRLIGDYNEINIQHMIALNDAVKRNLKNISRIHMLLLIKLEYIIKTASLDNIKSIDAEPSSVLAETQIPTVCSSPATAIMDKSTNNNKFEKIIIKENQPLIRKTCKCSLKGRGQGVVESRCDAFYSGIAIVQTGVSDDFLNRMEQKEEFLCYSVMQGTKMQIFIAYPKSLKFECLKTSNGISLKIEGLGSIIFKERTKQEKYDEGSFIFTVCHDDYESEKNTFEMIIEAKCNSDFNHISGKISTKCPELSLQKLN
jgi:hypothetical protein